VGDRRGAGQRGLAATTVAVLILLPLLVPEHLRLSPSWLAAVVGGLLLSALLVAYRAQQNRVTSLVRRLAIGLTLVLIVGAAWMTVRLLDDLVRGGPSTSSAAVLLSTGGLIWVNNNVLFGLLYWEIGRRHRDFAFPQQMAPEIGPPDWRPGFADYLYLGLTNGLAFSPTDVMPLTPRTKLTMAVQAIISFVVVGLVIARAVNVFA
jgi:uncharacterized membrane protein